MAKVTLQLIPYGGVEGVTVSAIVAETIAAARRGHDFSFVRTDGDSLLPRRRSVALSDFYERGNADVMITIDHDIQWHPGDVISTAERAMERDAIVGGLYSKRVEGAGWACRLRPVGEIQIPSDNVIECDYVGSGFMAIPRCVVRKILEDPAKALLHRCWDGKQEYWDFYATFSLPHPSKPHLMEYISEDWALCHRARLAGVPIYTDLRPRLIHYGQRGFTAADGIPKPSPAPTQQETAK